MNDGQLDFIELANKWHNVFLTWVAWSWKSFILNKWYEDNKDGKKIIKVAPTWIASINIWWTTIHKAFKLYWDAYHIIKKQSIDWHTVNTLIIDESSMVSCEMFDYMSKVIKKHTWSTKAFWWIQVICVWDLAQLPPVYNTRDEAIRRRYEKLIAELWWVQFILSEAYAEWNFVMLTLTEQRRSKDDKLNALLNRIRQWDMRAILEFQTNPSMQFRNKAVHIFHTNAEVDSYNEARLAKLPLRTITYKAQIIWDFNVNNVLALEELKLKVWARIMIIKNLDCWLVNWDLWEVVDLHKSTVTIFSDRLQMEIDIVPSVWQNVTYNESWEEEVHW
jgi:hypothetical protein